VVNKDEIFWSKQEDEERREYLQYTYEKRKADQKCDSTFRRTEITKGDETGPSGSFQEHY
jgi:hypothetical protein